MTAYDAWDREYQENKQDYLDVFDRFMSQSNYENNEEFERNFAERVGRKFCVSVASATDALHFALLAHGIGEGDEVLVKCIGVEKGRIRLSRKEAIADEKKRKEEEADAPAEEAEAPAETEA